MSKFAKGIYLPYLRKSRQDDPNETIEEVLSKHETMCNEGMLEKTGLDYGFDSLVGKQS